MNGLINFLKTFKDDKTCEDYLFQKRFSNGLKCLFCENEKVYKITIKANCQQYKCSKCKKRFSVITNTIFERSKIGLQTWFLAYYLL